MFQRVELKRVKLPPDSTNMRPGDRATFDSIEQVSQVNSPSSLIWNRAASGAKFSLKEDRLKVARDF